MNLCNCRFKFPDPLRHHVVALLAGFFLILSGKTTAFGQTQAQSQVLSTTTTEQEPAQKIPDDQLDSLVAPIALYPDPLLAQTLAASTYPLELVQLQQWMEKNPNLKDKALADAVAKQAWDPSVQALVVTPDVVQRLAGNIQWTTDLGNAFLAQQSDVMAAVQRMRAKAQGKGTLKTSEQQVVETKTVESGKQVIVVEPAQPDVVYVPSYDPAIVYGPPPPAYPYYPYTYPGYYPGMGLAWGAAGFALGAWVGGNWGNCDWNNGDININNKNEFNRNVNRNTNRNVNRGERGQGKWQHNPQHRGNAPYGDRKTTDKFGGNNRPSQGNRPGQGAGNRPGQGNRPSQGAGNRPAAGGGGTANRPRGGTSTRPSPGTRPSGGASTRPATTANRGGSRSPSQVGNRSVSSRPSYSGSRGGGFSGGSASAARASSSRGGHSMGGGGFSRGGGGGGRGGGGGGRR